MRSVRDMRYPSIRSEVENASSDDDVGEWRSSERGHHDVLKVSGIRIRAIGSDLIKVGGFRSRFCRSALPNPE